MYLLLDGGLEFLETELLLDIKHGIDVCVFRWLERRCDLLVQTRSKVELVMSKPRMLHRLIGRHTLPRVLRQQFLEKINQQSSHLLKCFMREIILVNWI